MTPKARAFAGLLLCAALAATAVASASESDARADAPSIAVRASLPFAPFTAHGTASFHLRAWQVALAWSSGRGHTRAGLAIARDEH